MTDELPPWDRDDPLDKWAPEPAEYARAGELWQQMLTDDPRFDDTFTAISDDVLTERNLPRVLAAILLHGRAMIEGNCSDVMLARVRLSADVEEARQEVIRERLYRDDTD